MIKYLVVQLFFFLLLLFVHLGQSDEDLINLKNITTFPQNYNHNIYGGYFNITSYNKSLYYIFAQSQSEPTIDPVILWLNGGPGCSSLMGFVSENGPFVFNPNDTTMKLNQHSWNKKANVLYLQSPSGVGFSQAQGSDNLHHNDTSTSKDNLKALIYFFERYPQYKTNNFYLAGQSYAGIYIPYLVQQILNHNKLIYQDIINLKGILLGNACTDPTQCYTSTYISRYSVEFLYTRGFFSQVDYNKYQSQCLNTINAQQTQICISMQQYLHSQFLNTKANIYNIYALCYQNIYPTWLQYLQQYQFTTTSLKHPLNCTDSIGSYILFNANQFRLAFHIDQFNDTLLWTPCTDNPNFQYQSLPQASFYKIFMMIKAGLKIIYYSGDNDAIVPVQGTLKWFNNLRNNYGISIKKSWRPWITSDQNVSGMVWQLQGITLATVIGAGHMVPSDKPEQAEQLLNILLQRSDWIEPQNYTNNI